MVARRIDVFLLPRLRARVLLLFLLVIVGAGICTAPSAHAFGLGLDLTFVEQRPGYTGGAYVVNPASLTDLTSIGSGPAVPAYRWTGSRWQKLSHPQWSALYVRPWGSGWSWTWTPDAGWLAMEQRNLLISS